MRLALIGIVALAGTLAGCGDTRSCQSACRKTFRDEQCNVQVPGESASDLISDCVTECEQALRKNGDLGTYDPNDPDSVDRSSRFVLDNEAQAAAWTDCVVETSCDLINDGICPGGGIN